MAKAPRKSTRSIGATLWSLLIIAFMGLVIAHLVEAVGHESNREGELIERTFTTTRTDR